MPLPSPASQVSESLPPIHVRERSPPKNFKLTSDIDDVSASCRALLSSLTVDQLLSEALELERDLTRTSEELEATLKKGKIEATATGFMPPPGVYPVVPLSASYPVHSHPSKDFREGHRALIQANGGIGYAHWSVMDDHKKDLEARCARQETVPEEIWDARQKGLIEVDALLDTALVVESQIETVWYCLKSFRKKLVEQQTGHKILETRAARSKDQVGDPDAQVQPDGTVSVNTGTRQWHKFGSIEAKLLAHILAVERLVKAQAHCNAELQYNRLELGFRGVEEIDESLQETIGNMLKLKAGFGILNDSRGAIFVRHNAQHSYWFEFSDPVWARLVGPTPVAHHLAINRAAAFCMAEEVKACLPNGVLRPFKDRCVQGTPPPVVIDTATKAATTARLRSAHTRAQQDLSSSDPAKASAAEELLRKHSLLVPTRATPALDPNPALASTSARDARALARQRQQIPSAAGPGPRTLANRKAAIEGPTSCSVSTSASAAAGTTSRSRSHSRVVVELSTRVDKRKAEEMSEGRESKQAKVARSSSRQKVTELGNVEEAWESGQTTGVVSGSTAGARAKGKGKGKA